MDSPVDDTTVVRLFYDPPGDYFHFPLVLRAVKPGSPLLDTAPMLEAGRTAYISVSDMEQLVSRLSKMDLVWKQTEAIESLGSFKKLKLAGIGGSTMQVLVERLTAQQRQQWHRIGSAKPWRPCT